MKGPLNLNSIHLSLQLACFFLTQFNRPQGYLLEKGLECPRLLLEGKVCTLVSGCGQRKPPFRFVIFLERIDFAFVRHFSRVAFCVVRSNAGKGTMLVDRSSYIILLTVVVRWSYIPS